MEGGANNGLRAKVDYLENRQNEDRASSARTAEHQAASAQAIAVLAKEVSTIQERQEQSEIRHDAVHTEQWAAIDKSREMGTRVLIALITLAIGYALAAYGGAPGT
jgi:hypothetical protein